MIKEIILFKFIIAWEWILFSFELGSFSYATFNFVKPITILISLNQIWRLVSKEWPLLWKIYMPINVIPQLSNVLSKVLICVKELNKEHVFLVFLPVINVTGFLDNLLQVEYSILILWLVLIWANKWNFSFVKLQNHNFNQYFKIFYSKIREDTQEME